MNPLPPWRSTSAKRSRMRCSCSSERGRIHTPFCRLTAPAPCKRRHTITRILEGNAGICGVKSSHSRSVIFLLLVVQYLLHKVRNTCFIFIIPPQHALCNLFIFSYIRDDREWRGSRRDLLE